MRQVKKVISFSLGLRRFIRDLEDDGRVYELYRRNMSLQGPIRGRAGDGDNDSTDDGEHMMLNKFSFEFARHKSEILIS